MNAATNTQFMVWSRFLIAVLRRGVFAAACAMLLSCGYYPVAGRLAAEAPPNMQFRPFVLKNNTPDLALTDVMTDALLKDLGERHALAPSSNDDAYRLHLSLNRVNEANASYAPDRSVIERMGELQMSYKVYPPGATWPILMVPFESLQFRYDFDPNPQIVRQYRARAIADSMHDLISLVFWRTATVEKIGHGVAPEPVTTSPYLPPSPSILDRSLSHDNGPMFQ